MQAYKIKKKAKELAKIWGISASVIASRILRNFLLFDFVLKCAILCFPVLCPTICRLLTSTITQR
jgi:hypothetical protein